MWALDGCGAKEEPYVEEKKKRVLIKLLCSRNLGFTLSACVRVPTVVLLSFWTRYEFFELPCIKNLILLLYMVMM